MRTTASRLKFQASDLALYSDYELQLLQFAIYDEQDRRALEDLRQAHRVLVVVGLKNPCKEFHIKALAKRAKLPKETVLKAVMELHRQNRVAWSYQTQMVFFPLTKLHEGYHE